MSLSDAPDVERSPSGSRVYRHEVVDRPTRPIPDVDSPLRHEVEAHLERHLGTTPVVFHELVSEMMHLDVFMFAPTEERPFHTFATVGMSDLEMTVPPSVLAKGAAPRAEVLVCLPPTWPLPEEGTSDSWPENSYFPMRWLKSIARLPHRYQSWLGFGHTVPNGDPPMPLSAETSLCGWMLMPPLLLPDEFRRLQVGDDRVDFFGLIALHPDEMDRKLALGVASLYEGFDRDGVSELLDITRPSTIRR